MSKRPAVREGDSLFAVSAWPLRRKMSLALAIPLLLAGTLGGLRVHSDLVASSNSASSAQQVTALQPAVAYLTAAQQAAVASVGTDTTSRAALGSAIDDIRAAGQDLKDAKKSAELTPAQADQVDAVLDLTQAMRDSDAVKLSPGTWQAGLRQLQSGVSQLITTIVNAQITPEPKLDLLSQALNGRFSLALEQALAAGDRSGKTGSTELYSELGAEGAAIDRLASGLGTRPEDRHVPARGQRGTLPDRPGRPGEPRRPRGLPGLRPHHCHAPGRHRPGALVRGRRRPWCRPRQRGRHGGRAGRGRAAGPAGLAAAAQADPTGPGRRARGGPRAAARRGRPHPGR